MTGRGAPALSVCIVNWNAGQLLLDCLAALLADPEAANWEVLLVDNASTDGSAAAAAQRFPQIRLLRNAHNAGFATASNQALALATGRHLLLLNPDTRVSPGALGRLVRFLDQTPGVGAAGPRLVDPSGRLQLSCGRTPSLSTETVNKLLLHKLFPFYKLGRWNHAATRHVGWVTGACIMVRREAVEAAGPLDSGIFMFYEDLEWCLRIRRHGWRVAYVPDSEVVHVGGHSVRQDFGRMLVISQRSLYYLFSKHYGPAAVYALRWLTVVEMALRTAVWLPLRVLHPRYRDEGRQRLYAYREIFRRTLVDRSYWAPSGAPGGGP